MNIDIRTGIVGGQWRYKITIIMEMGCQFISMGSIGGKFVTSQTAFFSRADNNSSDNILNLNYYCLPSYDEIAPFEVND